MRPSRNAGAGSALSEIVHLGGNHFHFLVLERDNQSGSYAAIKTVTLISLDGVAPAAYGGDLPVVEKELVVDLVPAMQGSRGWISDKPEGLAITGDGRVFTVIDNDGVDDASGETRLLLLGVKNGLT